MDDFENDWATIVNDKSPFRKATDKVTDLEGLLTLVAAEVSADMVQRHPEVPPAGLQALQSECIQAFMSRLYEKLRNQDLTGLLEFVLEGPGEITPAEVIGFMQALPHRLLARIVKSPVGTATGTHALVAFEVHRRAGYVHYEVTRDLDGRLVGTVTSNENTHEPLTFRLLDEFSMDAAEEEGKRRLAEALEQRAASQGDTQGQDEGGLLSPRELP